MPLPMPARTLEDLANQLVQYELLVLQRLSGHDLTQDFRRDELQLLLDLYQALTKAQAIAMVLLMKGNRA